MHLGLYVHLGKIRGCLRVLRSETLLGEGPIPSEVVMVRSIVRRHPPVAQSDAGELTLKEIILGRVLRFVEIAMRTNTLSAVCVVDLVGLHSISLM